MVNSVSMRFVQSLLVDAAAGGWALRCLALLAKPRWAGVACPLLLHSLAAASVVTDKANCCRLLCCNTWPKATCRKRGSTARILLPGVQALASSCLRPLGLLALYKQQLLSGMHYKHARSCGCRSTPNPGCESAVRMHVPLCERCSELG